MTTSARRQRVLDGRHGRGRTVSHGFVAGMTRTERDLMSGGGQGSAQDAANEPAPITAISTTPTPSRAARHGQLFYYPLSQHQPAIGDAQPQAAPPE